MGSLPEEGLDYSGLDPAGGVTLDVRFQVTIENTTGDRIILAKFPSVAGYEIRKTSTEPENSRPLVRFNRPKQELLDATKFDRTVPPATLFNIVEPGSTVERAVEVSFAIGKLQVVAPKLTQTYWLVLSLDHWPASEEEALNLRRSWSRYGLLWASMGIVGPIEMNVERSPRLEHCGGRVD
jgi:hypothetical protein